MLKNSLQKSTILSLVICCLILITGCSSKSTLESIPTNTPIPSTATPIPPTDTLPPPTETLAPTLTSTPLPPTETSTPEAPPTTTETVMPSSTPTEETSSQIVPGDSISLFYILPETGGPFACGDSLVSSYSGLVQSGDIKKDITSALNRLFSIGVKKIGNLYNPLYQSRLKVSSIDYNQEKKLATVNMIGKFVKPKDDCDQLRYREQVWATIRQFPDVRIAIVLVNDQLLGDLLAAKDK